MCGIVGILATASGRVERHEVQRMCAAIVHRGPDDQGLHVDGNVGLGMRRLSIIDPGNGAQPVFNEDRSVAAVLNGEIYNYRQLRADLEARGHLFRTGSDSETIVHLYEEHGPDCVSYMRGMFALAVWDARRRRLLLGRDRFGIKPLFYTSVDGWFVFASELKAILTLPWVPRDLSWRSLNHLFTSLTTPADESAVAGIHKLAPAHTLTLDAGAEPRLRRYWELSFRPDRRYDEAHFARRLREKIQESVRAHTVSDVPVGAFLSGGLDSSTVAAAMMRDAGQPIKTFSIGFNEPRYDESPHARRVARDLGTEHHELILEPDVSDLLAELIWHLDEPFGDSSAIPTYMVSKLAAREVKVVLSGDGGDEVFAGYDKYLVEQHERRGECLAAPLRGLMGFTAKRLPFGAKGRNFLRHFSLTGMERYLDAGALFARDDRRRLFQPEAAALAFEHDPDAQVREMMRGAPAHWLSRLQHLDLQRYLPLDILTKVDRMSMAHSLETRVPLLDHELVEFSATVPPRMMLAKGIKKNLLKQAMRGVLPDDIIDRPKQGFAVPLDAWFRAELDGVVSDILLSERTRSRGILDTRYIERLLKIHKGGRALDLPLWTLLSFELWCRTFLDGAVEAPSGAQGAPVPAVGTLS